MKTIITTAAAATLAALALAVTACASTQQPSASHPASAQAATTQPGTPGTYPQSAKAGQFSFRVVSVRAVRHLPKADQTMTAPAHPGPMQQFVIVKVAITNDGKVPQAADGGNISGNQGLMRDSRGASFTDYDGALNTSWVMGGNYNPGSTSTDDIVFEAPWGTIPIEMSLPAAGYGENGQMVSGPRYLSVLLTAR